MGVIKENTRSLDYGSHAIPLSKAPKSLYLVRGLLAQLRSVTPPVDALFCAVQM